VNPALSSVDGILKYLTKTLFDLNYFHMLITGVSGGFTGNTVLLDKFSSSLLVIWSNEHATFMVKEHLGFLVQDFIIFRSHIIIEHYIKL